MQQDYRETLNHIINIVYKRGHGTFYDDDVKNWSPEFRGLKCTKTMMDDRPACMISFDDVIELVSKNKEKGDE